MAMKGTVAWLLSSGGGGGKVIYWAGVTTTPLSDGSTTNPITIGGESVTVRNGGLVQYGNKEFFWNETLGAWQESGESDFGALAFKDDVLQGDDSTTVVNSIETVGTLPSYTLDGKDLIFNPGTLPTKGGNQTVVTKSGTVTVE